MLETGRYATISEIAKAERINSSYVSRVLRLTLLAPATFEAILAGRASAAPTLAHVNTNAETHRRVATSPAHLTAVPSSRTAELNSSRSSPALWVGDDWLHEIMYDGRRCLRAALSTHQFAAVGLLVSDLWQAHLLLVADT
jgi:hypothetical protein